VNSRATFLPSPGLHRNCRCPPCRGWRFHPVFDFFSHFVCLGIAARIIGRDLGALAGQCDCDGPTDSPRSAGDQDSFSINSSHGRYKEAPHHSLSQRPLLTVRSNRSRGAASFVKQSSGPTGESLCRAKRARFFSMRIWPRLHRNQRLAFGKGREACSDFSQMIRSGETVVPITNRSSH
jgi:hypothetical protein